MVPVTQTETEMLLKSELLSVDCFPGVQSEWRPLILMKSMGLGTLHAS